MIIMLSKSSKICGWLNSAQWQYTEILKKASKFVSKKVIASVIFFFSFYVSLLQYGFVPNNLMKEENKYGMKSAFLPPIGLECETLISTQESNGSCPSFTVKFH